MEEIYVILKKYKIPKKVLIDENGRSVEYQTETYVYQRTNQYRYFNDSKITYEQFIETLRNVLLYQKSNYPLYSKIKKELRCATNGGGGANFILKFHYPRFFWKWLGKKTKYKYGYTFYGEWVHAYSFRR